MRSLRFLATAPVAFVLCASAGHAEVRWSSAAGAGLAFTNQGVGSGAWADLMYAAVPNWSVGAEAGYVALPGPQPVVWLPQHAAGPFTGPYGDVSSTGDDVRMLSASGVVRGRSSGPLRVHFLGTFGYYDLTTPDRFSDRVEHERYPGFSLGIGLSGAGLVRPAFQLRWHEVLRRPLSVHPNAAADHLDIVTFEVGLHFN